MAAVFLHLGPAPPEAAVTAVAGTGAADRAANLERIASLSKHAVWSCDHIATLGSVWGRRPPDYIELKVSDSSLYI